MLGDERELVRIVVFHFCAVPFLVFIARRVHRFPYSLDDREADLCVPEGASSSLFNKKNLNFGNLDMKGRGELGAGRQAC